MRTRPFRRAATLALAGSLAVSAVAFADTVQADGDGVTPGVQGSLHIGEVSAAELVTVDVRFVLTCSNLNHVDPGQAVLLVSGGGTQPEDGAIVSVTDGSVGPVPADWTADGEGCPFPAPTLATGTPSVVTLRAPTALGEHEFLLAWDRSLTPAGAGDAAALGGMTSVTIGLEVVASGPTDDTTAPTLVGLPEDIDVTTSDPAGAVVTYTPPTATDDTDPFPTVTCAPESGSLFPLGTTTVTCTATDAADNSAQASFVVTVTQVPAPAITATWGEPVGAAGGTIVANRGRTIPVKVNFVGQGGEVTTGDAALSLTPCGSAGDASEVPLAVTGGKWQALVATAALSGDCYLVTATHEGVATRSFQLQLRGTESARGGARGR